MEFFRDSFLTVPLIGRFGSKDEIILDKSSKLKNLNQLQLIETLGAILHNLLEQVPSKHLQLVQLPQIYHLFINELPV
jgi:hypothetical protein